MSVTSTVFHWPRITQYLAQKRWVHVGVRYLVRITDQVAAQKFHHGYAQEDKFSLYVFRGNMTRSMLCKYLYLYLFQLFVELLVYFLWNEYSVVVHHSRQGLYVHVY